MLSFNKLQAPSKGNAGSSDKIRLENVSHQNGPIAELVGDLHAGGLIELIGHSDVMVDYVQTAAEIKAAGNQTSLTALGTISEHSACAASMTIPELILPANRSKKKVVLGNNQSIRLAPGDYAEVRLKRNSQLLMGSGVYNIKHWIFEKEGASVVFEWIGAPVIINISHWSASKNDLQFITGGTASARDVYYNVAGDGATVFNASRVQGNILAPKGNVIFDKESKLEGSCYAETISFKNLSAYSGHKYL